MKKYRIRVDTRAIEDIRDAVYYYNSKLPGRGKRFYQEVKDAYQSIQTVTFFQVRYGNIRCLPLKKFPYMIHYEINHIEGIIEVRAVVNCYKNPDTAWIVNEP